MAVFRVDPTPQDQTGYVRTETKTPPTPYSGGQTPMRPIEWERWTLVRDGNRWVWAVAEQVEGTAPPSGGVRIKAYNPQTGRDETHTVYGPDPRKEQAVKAGTSSSTSSGPSWTSYSIDKGKWSTSTVSGRRPVAGGYWAWAINPKTGRMERHKVYAVDDPNAGRAMTAQQVRNRFWNTGERYFNAATNRWDRRYDPTNAEERAKAQGLHKDGHGYYRMVDGHRQYVTGWDRDSGRRYHYESRAGRRTRVWDDPRIAPLTIEAYREARDELRTTRKQYENRLKSLREQYRNARADQHVLKRTILDRIRQMESTVASINTAIKDLPKPEFGSIHAAKRPKFDGGVKVVVDFSLDGYTFVNPLPYIPPETRVYVRATIELGERKWRPSLLAVPDMVRVWWNGPSGWAALDAKAVRAGGTDEYLCSNPLYLVREYQSPSDFKGSPTFVCRAAIYEFVLSGTATVGHWEGKG